MKKITVELSIMSPLWLLCRWFGLFRRGVE